jgi:hypothetical protein
MLVSLKVSLDKYYCKYVANLNATVQVDSLSITSVICKSLKLNFLSSVSESTVKA